jgi:hypothetical protein
MTGSKMPRLVIFPLLLLPFVLTGCYPGPFSNPNDWSATGAARQNIAIQAANPSDLISGKSDGTSNGVAASAAIDKALGGAAGTAAGLQAPPANASSMDITGS